MPKFPGPVGYGSGNKAHLKIMFATFYSSTETISFYTQVEKLLGANHFTLSAICSSAYIPPTVRFFSDAL
jgi:hypothetical protein